MDAKAKIQEIAALEMGGNAEDYELRDETVYATSDESKGMTMAQVAARAIELGGKYDGQEVPDDIFITDKKFSDKYCG